MIRCICRMQMISIHTPHAGSDKDDPRVLNKKLTISIHTPHAGSDVVLNEVNVDKNISIHTPHAGSDRDAAACTYEPAHISIHTPHAGSDTRADLGEIASRIISIHTPHAGSDAVWNMVTSCLKGFQSTLPMRGAT